MNSDKKMILKRSMGTQFGSLPKQNTTNEPRLAKITAQLEMNNHDGYCSGEECEYTKKTIKTVVPIPGKYKDCPFGKIDDTEEHKWAYHHTWAKYLPVPDINIWGSEYCRSRTPKGGVGQHQYRYTIKKVEIVENRKYKNKKGYLVMASDGEYSDYENEPYGISRTLEEANQMAREAVHSGSKRDSKWYSKIWKSKKSFDRASIINLDSMQKCGSCNKEYPTYEYCEEFCGK